MARYPAANWRPVKRYLFGGLSAVAMPDPNAAVDHTYVGNVSSDSAFNHFNVDGTPTPHFMFNRDGSVDQYIDTALCSTSVLDGKHRCITWETWDGFPDFWSDEQAPLDNDLIVAAKAKLIVWIHKTHGIPIIQLANSRSTSAGFGWHRLGIDGNFANPPGTLLGGRVEGGEHWSDKFGKTCPTDRRIKQFVNQTLPLAAQINQGDIVLSDEDKTWLKAQMDAQRASLLNHLGEGLIENPFPDLTAKMKLEGVLKSIINIGQNIDSDIAGVRASVGGVQAGVNGARTDIAKVQTGVNGVQVSVNGIITDFDALVSEVVAGVVEALPATTGGFSLADVEAACSRSVRGVLLSGVGTA